LFNENDINERIYWLIYQLHMDYETIVNMPWETVDWLYNRHVQQLIEMQKQQEEQSKTRHFI